MEKFDKYLQKKEENIIEEEDFFHSHPEFYKQIGRKTINENGSISYENGDFKISLKTEEFSDFLENHPKNNLIYSELFFMPKTFSIDDYLRLTEFKLKDKNVEYDLASEKGKPIVIFKKIQEGTTQQGHAYNDLNIVRITGDPATPEGVLTIVHELGHLQDEGLDKTYNRLRKLHSLKLSSGGYTNAILKEENALTLEKERKAWAYALKTLRPFIKGLGVSGKSIKEFIHDVSLGSYCRTMDIEYDE